ENVEAEELVRRGIPYYSMPSFMERFILPDYNVLVVAGTHGKSTTTSMLATTLDIMGESPSFLVGAIPLNFGQSFRTSTGRYFVIEGDEYDTAFFDKVPKFLHYLPYSAIITSIEFDHADIYSDFEVYKEQFVKFSKMVNREGFLVLKDDEVIKRIIKRDDIPLIFYGENQNSDAFIRQVSYKENFMEVSSTINGKEVNYRLQVYGFQNALNSLSVITFLGRLGFETNKILTAIEGFKGVKRRMEFIGDYNGIGVIDDFAHHPTAVRITIDAARKAYIETGRYKRLISIFEPRSNTSRRNIFFDGYSKAFLGSDIVVMAKPYKKDDGIKDELNVNGVLQNLEKCGIKGFCGGGVSGLKEVIMENARKGDLLLFMSNGDFGGLLRETVNLLKGDV
ncbi:MAG: UDP-N-acetylmuramate--L-alanine ligase, partial [Myxococcota bacterium]